VSGTQSEWDGGAYWDNISLDIVDGAGAAPLGVDIWQLYQDTFPSNDNAALVNNSAAFDTTTAYIKSGLNVAPPTGDTHRFMVPGDTTVVIAGGDSVRVDLVFRILPGPGNYVNPTLGRNSQLKAAPTAAAPIPAPASGSTNFWSNYMFSNGTNGSAGGHPTATSGPLAGQKIWSPNVWNSARCDTADVNVFQLHKRSIRFPARTDWWMTAYHEADIYVNGVSGALTHRGALTIARNVCFVADTATSVSVKEVICGDPAGLGPYTYPPAWTSAPGSGYNGVSTTREGNKIIPDGLLTPGSHVEYFFRRQDGTDPNVFLMPDTNAVTPQNLESSTDGHRWQEFSVLPDSWKKGKLPAPGSQQLGLRPGLHALRRRS